MKLDKYFDKDCFFQRVSVKTLYANNFKGLAVDGVRIFIEHYQDQPYYCLVMSVVEPAKVLAYFPVRPSMTDCVLISVVIDYLYQFGYIRKVKK